MTDITHYFWICLSAMAAGAVNALAGGGTLLTFPTLIGALQPTFGSAVAPVLANGTSTVALVPASAGSAWAFRRELSELRRLLVWLLPPSVFGGALGTLLVTELPPTVFANLVPWLILSAAVLFLLQPLLVRRKAVLLVENGRPVTTGGADDITGLRMAGLVAAQFCIALYGGYFGAGIGILMLASLGFMGLTDIHQMNGAKAVLGTAINGVAIGIWIYKGKVVWPYALAMMVASLAGGYVAAHYSRAVPAKYVRWLVITIGFGLATYYFVGK